MRRLTFNPENPKQTLVVQLGGRTYRIRQVWRERLRAWYLEISLVDGTEVAMGVRVAANATLVADMNRWDSSGEAGGVLFALGRDCYAREDLGVQGGINVYYASREEWVEVSTISDTGALSLLVTA